MSIYGINTNILRLPTQQPGIRDNSRTPTQPSTGGVPTAPATVTQTPANAKTAQAGQSVPTDPPPGTDPALWSILSGEERAFFAKAGAMGPLTYGRAFSQMKSAPLPAARGGRLDVKV